MAPGAAAGRAPLAAALARAHPVRCLTPRPGVGQFADSSIRVGGKGGRLDLPACRAAGWQPLAYKPLLPAPYAGFPEPTDVAGEFKALALYGVADPSNRPRRIEKREAECTATDQTCEKIVSPNALNSFNANYRPSYSPETVKDGWANRLAWLKQNGMG
jgi:hypothetical protein